MRDRKALIVEQIPRLRRYARALTGDAELADDLVQDSVERAWRKLHLWRPGSDLRAWMFTIMRHIHVNAVRKGMNRPPVVSLADWDGDKPLRPVQEIAVEARAVVDALALLLLFILVRRRRRRSRSKRQEEELSGAAGAALDEAFLDLAGTERLLGAPPALSMARLAQTIEREIGITVSVGLSHNKYLAKVASDLDKPRGFSVIGRAETLAFLAPRPVRSIWGVGAALAGRLEADGIHAIADLRPLGAAELVARYGRIGQRLHELSHGIDPRRVDPDQPVKSISAETTFEADIADRDRLCGHLWRLSVKTSDRAKAKGLAGGTVTLKLKCADFRALTRQDRLASPTSLAETIYRHGEALLVGMLERAPFRLIGIGISDLVEADGAAAPPSHGRAGKRPGRNEPHRNHAVVATSRAV